MRKTIASLAAAALLTTGMASPATAQKATTEPNALSSLSSKLTAPGGVLGSSDKEGNPSASGIGLSFKLFALLLTGVLGLVTHLIDTGQIRI